MKTTRHGIARRSTLALGRRRAARPAVPAAAGAGSAAAADQLAHLDFLLDTATPAEVRRAHHLPPRRGARARSCRGRTRTPATAAPSSASAAAPSTRRPATGARAPTTPTTSRAPQSSTCGTGSRPVRTQPQTGLRAAARARLLPDHDGPNAGNVVLWMQPDGELNPSAEPVELPDPSDSDESYWLARTIWAFGEGYAAFRDADPAFAAFLGERLQLARRRGRPRGARPLRRVRRPTACGCPPG